MSNILFTWFLIFLSCSSSSQTPIQNGKEIKDEVVSGTVAVTAVSISGAENQYNFRVTLESDDTGCEQYADWWEVIDSDGNLIYRRILTHSHINEQPFTRSGGPIAVSSSTEVYVRAHMNNSGYGTRAFKGNATEGLNTVDLSADFAKVLQTTEPLPNGCAF